MRNRKVATYGWRALVSVVALAATSIVLVGSAGAGHAQVALAVDGDVNRVAGVYLEVPVSVTCPTDFAPFTYVYTELVSVTVTQRAGREIARGGGSFFFYDDSLFGGFPHGTPLTCDGSPHVYTINVFPSQGSPAFKGGKAVVQLSALIELIDPFAFQFDRVEGSAGPQTISIKG
ncbi:MAG TPA: hypothetical protein VFR32_03715 [Gaiellaceae bacterium]|nr:hypothetical protein [Gaiellaceae bacterium]